MNINRKENHSKYFSEMLRTCQCTLSQPCAPENSKLLLISRYKKEHACGDNKHDRDKN